MGTYTTNYNLFLPTIGEQGWGTLVNGNFTTIDTTMKSLSNRMGTAESNFTSLDSRLDIVETYGSRIAAIENEVNGNLSCNNITVSGKITTNGGFSGAFNIGSIITPLSTNFTGVSNAGWSSASTNILQPLGFLYSGSLRVQCGNGGHSAYSASYTIINSDGSENTVSITNAEEITVNFSNIAAFRVTSSSPGSQYGNGVAVSSYTNKLSWV